MAKQPLLFRILRATHANGTHHKLALDALKHLRGPDAEAWRRVFLNEASSYLEGSKAPDKEFKDFTNHVLHVRDGFWGGAAEKTTAWYGHTVEALQARNWREAAYAAGVMSHYYTDPIMPFHTAQSEAENNIHRAAEWSISKSYDDLTGLGRREFPVPDVPIEDREDWVADLVCDAAEISNTFYEKLIANYDLDRGVVDPVTGLNERARRIVAQLLAYAQVGQARILERAFAEAGVQPPEVALTAETVLASLQIPVKWVLRKLEDAEDRAAVAAMYDELQSSGRVEKTLSQDDRAVRTAFRREVGEKSASPRPAFRPPHRGGAFDYASALKSGPAAAAVLETATVKNETATRIKPTADEIKPTKASKVEKAEPTKTVVKPEEPIRTDVVASLPVKASPQVEEKRATKQEVDAPKADKAIAPTKSKDNSADKAGRAQRKHPVMPKIGREDRVEEVSASAVSEPEETRADEDEFDAATVLRQRAAEMEAADKPTEGTTSTPDFRLAREDEVEDGPSVGPKTALRLNKVGIITVQDLLDADPTETAEAVDVPYIRPKTIVAWQDQARLQCEVPGLAGTASQLIVGAGVRSASELAAQDVDALTKSVAEFADSSEGNRLLRDRAAPERAQIAKWIANAAFSATSKAA